MHLGIDLGGTKIEIIALDGQSRELYRKRIPSPKDCYADTLSTLVQLVQETESELGSSESLGIGIPGAISPDTGRIKNANSTWLIGERLNTDLERELNRPVWIANDADCFALSEATDGAAKNAGIVFGVILGTGVGGGLCIHQQVVCGPNAITGEWGHNPLPADNTNSTSGSSDPETFCYCGKKNCIETYLSGPSFLNHFSIAFPDRKHSFASAEALANALDRQDEQIHAYFETYLDRLARSLTLVINIVDPDVIVLGGGLSNIRQLYERLPNSIARFIFSDSVRTQIVKAKHGDSSGVRGAAWLGMRQMRDLDR